MASISETIRRFQVGAAGGLGDAGSPSGRLAPLTGFGTNPGALDGWFYAPEATADMALVVVLHGCTQNAAGYDLGSGWSDLAERYGFAVLFPEQRRANNSNLCFNWFAAEDNRRDTGEALSIRQMIGVLVARQLIDQERIFVTGLSAGGAMTAVMLATYPELFAGGSIIAGLPYGVAASVPQAMERMRGAGHGTMPSEPTACAGRLPMTVHGPVSPCGMAMPIVPSMSPTPTRSSASGGCSTALRPLPIASIASTATSTASG